MLLWIFLTYIFIQMFWGKDIDHKKSRDLKVEGENRIRVSSETPKSNQGKEQPDGRLNCSSSQRENDFEGIQKDVWRAQKWTMYLLNMLPFHALLM